MKSRTASGLVLIVFLVAGCETISPTSSDMEIVAVTFTASPTSDSTLFLSQFAFPSSIDPTKQYMFYLHGRTIEDQGIPAVSAEYGEYQYKAILEKLASYGFVVISEQRQKGTDGMKYAERATGQVIELLDAGVPAPSITVVGASQGAAITITISSLLAKKDLNFVLMGMCNQEAIEFSKQQHLFLYGNVLTIRDLVDSYAGSCEELFSFSEGKIQRHEELVLHLGAGHSILYKPLDKWILPTVQWADQ